MFLDCDVGLPKSVPKGLLLDATNVLLDATRAARQRMPLRTCAGRVLLVAILRLYSTPVYRESGV